MERLLADPQRMTVQGTGGNVKVSAELLVVGDLSAEHAIELEKGFAAVVESLDIRQLPRRRTLGDIAWIALLAVPLKPFIEQFATDAATDSYKKLKALLGKVWHVGQNPVDARRSIVLQDNSTGVQIVLEPDLPDAAYEELLNFDLAAVKRGPVHFDRHRGEWRSVLDEAMTKEPPQA